MADLKVTPTERDLLIRTVIGEAANQPDEGKAAVAYSVFNRLNAGGYGDDIQGVLFKRKQYEPWETRSQELMSYSPEGRRYKSAASVIDGILEGKVPDPTNGATHFANVDTVKQRGNTSALNWINGMQNVTQIGAHTFGNADAGRIIKVANKEPAFDVEALANKYGGTVTKSETSAPSTPSVAQTDFNIDSLASKYGVTAPVNPPSPTAAPLPGEDKTVAGRLKATGAGVVRGVFDVTDTIGKGIGYVDKTVGSLLGVGDQSTKRAEEFNKRVGAQQSQFEKDYADSNEASVGRIGGQALATAPFVPGRVIQGVSVGMKSLPTVLATGERIAAPLVNRLGAATTIGAIAGAESGLLTSGSNDKSVSENIGQGALYGAVGGPLVAAGGAVLSKVGQSISNMLGNRTINNLAKESGIDPGAVRNILARLDDAGINPEQAKIELARLGPKATIADLDAALTSEASGLAARGGKTTSQLKNAFSDRAAQADDAASDLITNKLGTKPDLVDEAATIVGNARAATGPDYKLAHANATPLDLKPIADNIDVTLNKAVGKEANQLKEIKGYLYNDVANSDGTVSKVLKTDVESLHKVRQALDDKLDALPSEGTSAKSATYRAVNSVRKAVDDELKKIPEMASADAKFAEAMTITRGLDAGSKAFKKGNYEAFEKQWTSANPDTREAIKKGMRAAIGDLMEAAQKGDLSGAQRLFAKTSVNREKLKLAFGQDADEILDALRNEASQRATERAITQGSQTAERQAVSRRYGGESGEPTLLGDAVRGVASDVAIGSPGVLTIANTGRKLGSNLFDKMRGRSLERMAEGSADLLSRQGQSRDNALSILTAVEKVGRNISPTPLNKVRLPVTLSAPVGESAIEGGRKPLEITVRAVKGFTGGGTK